MQDLPANAFGVLRDAQAGFTRFDLYFMNDRMVAVKTISSRAVILSALLGGFIGMMLVGSRAEAKKRQLVNESITQGRLETLADFVIPYKNIASAKVKNGFFAGSLIISLKNGRSRKLTFASDNFASALDLLKSVLGSRLAS